MECNCGLIGEFEKKVEQEIRLTRYFVVHSRVQAGVSANTVVCVKVHLDKVKKRLRAYRSRA